MPKKGDLYEVILSETHISWGEHRHTDSREAIRREHFIPIPRAEAKRIGIYNRDRGQGIGKNEFYATSTDGIYNGIVKVSGSSSSGDPYAKNISESGNLKGFHEWFCSANIKPGTRIRVEWLSPTEILFTKI